MTDQKKLVLNINSESLEELFGLAQRLNTTPGGVISQALALLKKAQGKTVVIKENRQNTDLEIHTYTNQSA